MYEFISGIVDKITDVYIVISLNGIGYRIYMTNHNLQIGDKATIYVYEDIKETHHHLYGFTTKKMCDAFSMLLTIKGIGVKLASKITNNFTISELELIIKQANVKKLCEIKGISKNLAKLIIDQLSPLNPIINEVYQILIPLNIDVEVITDYFQNNDINNKSVEIIINEIVQKKG